MLIAETTRHIRADHERSLENRTGARHAIAFGYARIALRSILSAIGTRAGDAVVLSPVTCRVVPLTLLSLNLKPVYADISADTLNLDPDRVAAAAGPSTRAILFQHTYGNAAGLETVAAVAARLGIPLLEDCAQCLPWAQPGGSIGTTGLAAIFSNNLMKPLPAGSGGVAVTNDDELAAALRKNRDALPPPGALFSVRRRMETWLQRRLLVPSLYWPALMLYGRFTSGYRVRPVAQEISADILGAAHGVTPGQMRDGARWTRRLDSLAAARLRCCADYADGLGGSRKLTLPLTGTSQPLYYFPVLTTRKQTLLRQARRQLLEIVAWPRSTPIYPVDDPADLSAYGYSAGSCLVAERVAAALIGLPTHEKVGAAHRMRIIRLLRSLDDED
jgi:dTDP-4-amino-4,6-dideoxygalactose transaminase